MSNFTLTKTNALNGKKLIDWEWLDFWNLAVGKYRVSKKIRKLINKTDKGYDFNELAKILKVDRHYIYQVMVMNIKPSQEFLNKLNEVLNG